MIPSNSCGDCDLCCRLLMIEELGKPAGLLCRHYAGACAVYADRPASCRGFRCQWLKSESLPPLLRMGPEWRPDRAHLTMYEERDGMRLNIAVEPSDPDAWKREPYYGHIKRIAERAREGLEIVVSAGDRRVVVFPETDIDLGRVAPDQEIVAGYKEQDLGMRPYATLVKATKTLATRARDGASAP